MWALRLYRFIAFIAGPFLLLSLAARARRGRENPARLAERRGVTQATRPKGRLIWFHAASVGETNSILPLIADIFAADADINILLTTGTTTSAERVAMAQNSQTPKLIHQFAPLDRRAWAAQFLDHWRPDMAGWVESEIWPNMVLACAERDIPLVMINGRLSDRSFARWQKIAPVARKLLSCFSFVMAQDQTTAKRLRALGAEAVDVFGNLKLDTPPLGADETALSTLMQSFAGRPVWLAASTHDGEESVMLDVHKRVQTDFPDLMTIIVPRHANRGDAIAAQLIRRLPDASHLAQRSHGQQPRAQTQIYLADTMGELGLFYHATNIVFIGGTLVPHGGQNPIEAAALGCAILHGPHTHNFTEIFADLHNLQGALKIKDSAALSSQLYELLQEPSQQKILSEQALAFVETQIGARRQVLKALQPYCGGVHG